MKLFRGLGWPGLGLWIACALAVTARAGDPSIPSPLPSVPVLDPRFEALVRSAGLDREIVADAEFDPSEVIPGETAIYRLAVTAGADAVALPPVPPVADGLVWGRGASGTTVAGIGGDARPCTVFNFRVLADAPGARRVADRTLTVNGRVVAVPAAELRVVPSRPGQVARAPRLAVELPEGPFAVGRSLRVHVLALDVPGETVFGLSQLGGAGPGLLFESVSGRQRREIRLVDGRPVAVVVEELGITPLRAGSLRWVAQAFALVSRSGPGGVRLPEFRPLLESEAVTLEVGSVPAGEARGETGTGLGSEAEVGVDRPRPEGSGDVRPLAAGVAGEEPGVPALPVGLTDPSRGTDARWTALPSERALAPFHGLSAVLFAVAWGWDRRRRHLAEHPEIGIRRHARRAVRCQVRRLRRAAKAREASGFVAAAARALCEASAPSLGASASALVADDVLRALPERHRSGPAVELVQAIFQRADAARFAGPADDVEGLLEEQPRLMAVLDELLNGPVRR